MAEFEFDLSNYDPRNPFAGDERLPVEFYMEAVQDPEASEKAGRPVWKEVEAIKIFVNKDEITVHAPVYETDKQRWPKQYAAWKQTGNNKPGMMGMPLSKWPAVNKAQVQELEYFKVFTVEQLTELPATTIQKIPGLQTLVNQAKVHMEIARGEAPMHRMTKELEERDEKIRLLNMRLEALESMPQNSGQTVLTQQKKKETA